jgi:hypothetical protein
VVAILCVGSLSACGGGGARQDENEPEGKFPVSIVTAEFPTRQRLAESTFLRLGVRNTGRKTVPGLAVTISIAGKEGEASVRPFSIRDPQVGLAVPDRPVWILENGYPRLAGSSLPAGAQTANVKTFDFGPLKEGKTVEAIWKVTAVKPGNYKLTYRIDAGLNGKAKAVTADGLPVGSFAVQISNVPPQTRVNDKGEVVEIGGAQAGGSGKNAQGSGSAGG